MLPYGWMFEAEIGLARARVRGKADRIEQADLAFHQRVQQGFCRLALDYPQRIVRIDAQQSVEACAFDDFAGFAAKVRFMVVEAWASLLGQEQAIALLQGAIAQKRIAPAYLFAGSPGVGRSLAARGFIEQLFCQDLAPQKQALIKKRLQQGNHPDLLWIKPTYLHNGNLLSEREAAEKGLSRKAPPQIRLEQIREIGQFLGRAALEAPARWCCCSRQKRWQRRRQMAC